MAKRAANGGTGLRAVSLKDLAAHVGVSEGTVSRALNNYADISPKTRARVQQAALELGYSANPVARRLATGVAEAVAYLMPQQSSAGPWPFISQLLAGLGESLSQRGWDLLVTQSVPAESEPEMIRKLVTSGRVSGVVLSRPRANDARIKLLMEAKFPFIVHGRSNDCADYAWYDVDSHAAMIDATDHLVALGHSRIGFIGAPTYFAFGQMRLEGYRTALTENGLPVDDTLVQIAELTDEGGERAAEHLLDLTAPPTALVCSTDMQALGALAAIRARHLVPGVDVSVIGYDGLAIGRHANPPLTSMAQPQTHSGRQLGDMLLAIIDGGDPTDFQELRRASLVRRKSDGPAPQAVPHTTSTMKREEPSS